MRFVRSMLPGARAVWLAGVLGNSAGRIGMYLYRYCDRVERSMQGSVVVIDDNFTEGGFLLEKGHSLFRYSMHPGKIK